MELINNQIPRSKAVTLAEHLAGNGFPTEDRILIVSPTGEQKTKTGIIISSSVDKKDLPRKGVVIQNNSNTQEFISVGSVVTYGMYAGKEIHLDEEVYDILGVKKEDYTFTVLTISEVIYVEKNKSILEI